ncbi:MAG: M42 family metallopeptidase [Limnochordia bacterium]
MGTVDAQLEMLRELTEAAGLPGFEGEASAVLKRLLLPVAETVEKDNLGSLIAKKSCDSAGPRVMIAGHMDEIGFLVSSITDEGFLRFQTLGGWWEQVMLAQRVVVKTRQGDIPGIIGSKPPHVLSGDERRKPVEKKNMFIDIGVRDKAEAEAKGVTPGDPIVPVCPFTVMANDRYLMAKAWDNRIGCATVVEVLRALQGEQHPNTVFGVMTVQEEVGLRGAMTSAHAVQPDIGIALDVCIAGDTPGIGKHEAQSKLGQGPAILLYDASMVPHVGLRNLFIDTAKEEGIPIQFEALAGGGTDAGRIHLHGRGVPSVVIGFPTRYIHSAASVIHRDDFENTVRLVVAVIKKLDRTVLKELLA